MKNILQVFSMLLLSISTLYAQTIDTISGAAACGAASVSGTWIVPCGVTSITIEVYGAGGGAGGGGGGSNGGLFNTRGGGGAGGGGYTTTTINVLPGASFSYSVGSGGCGGSGGGDGSSGNNGNAGGNSSFTGADAVGTPVNLTANGGARGTGGSGTGGGTGNGGAGGTASGGTTNLNGVAGNNGSGGNGGAGGAGAGPGGGAGGPNTNNPGNVFGGGGAGGGDSPGGRGAAGGIIITLNTPVVLPPTPTISATPPTCTVDGMSAISNFDPAATYIFSPTGPSVGVGGAITGMVTGTSYTVIASVGGCDSPPSSSFSNMAAAPIPVPTVATTPPDCNADGFSTISNFDPAFTYIFNPTGPSVGAGGSITGLIVGTSYTVEASDGTCNSQPSNSFSIAAQFPAPTATISGSSSFCTGGSTRLTASGGTSFQWFDFSLNNLNNTDTITLTQGSFFVIVTDANGCTDSASIVVTETTSLSISIVGDSVVCPGETTTITAVGGTSFAWDDPNNSTTDAITVPAGTYTVVVSDLGGCTGTTTVNVTERNAPTVTITGVLGHCPGETTTITANGADTYLWDDPNNSNTPDITIPQGNYTVVGTDTNGCTATAVATVVEFQLPTITFIGDSSLCEGTTTSLTAVGAASFVWDPVTGLSDPNIPNPIISLVADTTFTVTGTDTNGCVNTASVTVTVVPVPQALFEAEPVCEGEAVSFVNNSTPANLNYNWDFGNGNNSTLENPVVNFNNDGTFTVTLIADNGACADTFSLPLEIFPRPTADFNANFTRITLGDTIVRFFNNSIDGENWFWDFGDSSTISTGFEPTHSFAEPGLFTVTLIATTNNGCADTLVRTDYIEVIEKPLIFIPNAFSPNGDDNNDVFKVEASGITTFYLTIHDRWGGQMFETEDPNEAWDGTFKGKLLNQGVYVYYIKASFSDLTIRSFKGSIKLIVD